MVASRSVSVPPYSASTNSPSLEAIYFGKIAPRRPYALTTAKPSPLQPVDRHVESGEEGRAVAGGEGLGAAGHVAHGAQVFHEVAGCERHADGGFGKRLAGGADHLGAGLDAAAREGNVGGDHDGAGAGPFGDPIIRRIEARADHDALDHRI